VVEARRRWKRRGNRSGNPDWVSDLRMRSRRTRKVGCVRFREGSFVRRRRAWLFFIFLHVIRIGAGVINHVVGASVVGVAGWLIDGSDKGVEVPVASNESINSMRNDISIVGDGGVENTGSSGTEDAIEIPDVVGDSLIRTPSKPIIGFADAVDIAPNQSTNKLIFLDGLLPSEVSIQHVTRPTSEVRVDERSRDVAERCCAVLVVRKWEGESTAGRDHGTRIIDEAKKYPRKVREGVGEENTMRLLDIIEFLVGVRTDGRTEVKMHASILAEDKLASEEALGEVRSVDGRLSQMRRHRTVLDVERCLRHGGMMIRILGRNGGCVER
jgi:hypothetical protein